MAGGEASVVGTGWRAYFNGVSTAGRRNVSCYKYNNHISITLNYQLKKRGFLKATPILNEYMYWFSTDAP